MSLFFTCFNLNIQFYVRDYQQNCLKIIEELCLTQKPNFIPLTNVETEIKIEFRFSHS